MPKVWNKRDPNCPRGAVYVGRPSKWGNPFPVRRHTKAEHLRVIGQYQDWLDAQPDRKLLLAELRGKDLICWCKPLPCHADLLLRLSNI